MGHWIDKNWILHEALLAFTLLEASHTGAKLAREIFKTLHQFNIAEKLYCITTDNASNNTKAMRMLAKLLRRHIYGSRATNTNTNTEFSFLSKRKGLFGSCS